MVDRDEKIAAIASELGVTVDVVVSLLQKAFDNAMTNHNGELVCEWSDVKKTIRGGKTLFSRVVKAAVRSGLLERREVVVFGQDKKPENDDLRDYWGLNPQTVMIDVFAGATWDAYKSTEEKYRRQIDDVRSQMWYPELVEIIVDLYRNRHRSEHSGKEPSAKNLFTFIYSPLLSYQKKFTRAQMHQGLDVAVSRGVSSPRYVYKVAEGSSTSFANEPVLTQPRETFTTEDGRVCGPLDKWCLDHPVYREKYIELFGNPDD